MSSRVGPIIVGITSVVLRIAGDHGSADILAVAALGMLTIALQRGGSALTEPAIMSSAWTPVPRQTSSMESPVESR
jgi:hypothetical protein